MAANKNTNSNADHAALNEQFLAENIARLDERVKNLNKNLEDFEEIIKDLQNDFCELSEKLVVLDNEESRKEFVNLRNKAHALELRFENIQFKLNNHDNRWNHVFDTIWKVAIMVIASFILYKLGLPS